MTLRRVLVSSNERRLRAGWRLALQLLIMLAGAILFSLAWGLASQAIQAPPVPEGSAAKDLTFLGDTLISLLAITVSVYFARRWLDRRSFDSLGLQRGYVWRDLLFGIALSGALMALIYAAGSALGWVHFQGFAWQLRPAPEVLAGTVIWILVFVMVGWQEELLSRGYWLRNLQDGLNLPLAVLLSSAFFSMAHLSNPNVTWTAVVGLLAAGVWFAYACLRSGQLWLPIGLHIGWNFFEGKFFGFQVSGLTIDPLIHQSGSGPVLWTGGAFGPEAGLIVLPVLVLGAVAIWAYTHGRAGQEI